MKHCCFLLLALFYIPGFSQTGKVSGYVTSAAGDTIPGALLYLRNDRSIITETGINGRYDLDIPSGTELMLIAEAADMLPDSAFITVAEGEQRQLSFQLKPVSGNPTELDEFVVLVGKFDTRLEDQTVSLEILKPKLLESKNTRSIETALDQVPGLNILDGEPQIRGGSGFTFGVGAKVAVIVDDMPMLSGDAGRPEWGFVPVENIHQVEVTKGAASVLSGSAALSGSIHIRTAYPTDKPLTRINLYSGLYDAPDVERAKWYSDLPVIAGMSALHTRKTGRWDVVIGGNFNYDHGFIGPPVTAEFVQEDTLTNFSNRRMASQRARFNFNLRYRSKIRGLSYGVNGNAMISHSNLVFAWLNDTSGLYRAYPGAMFLQDQLIFNLDPFVQYINSNNVKHTLRTRILRTVNELTANQSNQSTVTYANYQYQHKIPVLKGTDFVAGITAQNTHSYANIYSGSGSPFNDLLNLSGYLQAEKKFLERITLSAGARMEYFQLNDSITALKPIFRAGANVRIAQETYIRMSYGQGYRFPTITERYIKTGVGNFGVFPNPGLKPESSWNAEIGVKQGTKFGKLMGYLDAAFFWQEYQNTIEYMFGIWDATSPTSFAGFKFLNTGRSRVTGVDISYSGMAKLNRNTEVTFLAGYNYIVPITLNPDYVYATDDFNRQFSYNKTSLDSSGRILKYRFLHNVKLDAEITFRKKLAVGVSMRYFSKIVNMDAIVKDFEELTQQMPYIQDIRYMDYYNSHRHGNIVFDARISFAFSRNHKLAVIGSNIFNNVYSLRPLKIEPPRTIMLQYTYSL